MKQVALTPIEISYTQRALLDLKKELEYGYDANSILFLEKDLKVINQILEKIS